MKNIRRLLHKDPSKWIGLAGTLVSLAVVFTKLSSEQGTALQKILDALLVLIVGGTATGIRTQAYAPATVVEKVGDAVTETVSAVTEPVGAIAGAVVSPVAAVTEKVLPGLLGGLR